MCLLQYVRVEYAVNCEGRLVQVILLLTQLSNCYWEAQQVRSLVIELIFFNCFLNIQGKLHSLLARRSCNRDTLSMQG